MIRQRLASPPHRVVILVAAGLVAISLVTLVVNTQTTITDLALAGQNVPDHLVWSWGWSSMLAWFSLYPALWRLAGWIRTARRRWLVIALVCGAASLLASAWHIGWMVALRLGYYAVVGEGPYRFFAQGVGGLAYEYRKDLLTFAQFLIIAVVAQGFIGRQAGLEAATSRAGRALVLVDGAARRIVHVDEIDLLAAAGNYVEIEGGQLRLLHRSSLAALENKLGEDFVRIHRRTLVRRGAIREIRGGKSGDFLVVLQDGRQLRGSRRYRAGVTASLART